MAPGDIWGLTVREFILEGEARRPRNKALDYAGDLTLGDLEDLMEWDGAAGA